MNARRSDWLPNGQEPRRPEYFWSAASGSGRYSVRTPWLSVALAVLMIVVLVGVLVTGVVLVASGDSRWWFMVILGGLVLPLAIWGAVLAVRYARAARRTGRRAPLA